ncbi:ribbon-helix-helix domain-containing protein [Akkermansia sp. N21116]|uniref:ribbon-helix-helix domain-containing protein n=1 Tax=Akkermansia sp. N21116 TaxID=3040764 RepID=UPI00244F0175|nr:ribbon-helix-helix domain-containing protein [Akkermansia sp. N21116]WPX40148.1 ribbon-helix-helix domain-containing protein [Akkermansia sp. N21116]
MATLSQSIQVRLLQEDDEELRALSKATGVPYSALLRLSVQLGVPLLKNQLNQKTPNPKKAE